LNVASGVRALEPGSDLGAAPQARSWRSAGEDFSSNIYCYTSLDLPDARSAVDAVNAMSPIDLQRDFIVSEPMLLGADHEEIVREHTADSKRAVFRVCLTKTSALSGDDLSALLRRLKRGFPDLLVLWENQLRL